MTQKIKIPLLLGPDGHWYAYGFGHNGKAGDVDEGLMLDNTEDWPGGDAFARRVDVEVEVTFPDAEPPVIPGAVAAGGPEAVVELHAKLQSYAQKELLRTMGDVSESVYSAGWMDGIEFSLWEAVQSDQPTTLAAKHIRNHADNKTLDRIKRLSEEAGGWFAWDNTNDKAAEASFVPLEEWTKIYDAETSPKEAT